MPETSESGLAVRELGAGPPFQSLNGYAATIATMAAVALALVGAGLLSPSAHAATPSELEIARPAGALVTERTLRVVVRTPAVAPRSFVVRLDGTNVTRSLRRVRPGRYEGTVRVRGGYGRKLLTATFTGRTWPRRFARAGFVLGRRDRGLVRVVARRTRDGAALRLRLSRTPDHLVARLNGRDITREIDWRQFRRHDVTLTPDEGLRHGHNILTVRAVHRGGGYDLERRAITVARSRPLAAAGRERRHPARAPLRLDGRASRAATPGAGLRYRWVLTARPRGSRAVLRGASTARPTLVPDRAGRYRARLLVRETSRRARAAQAPVGADTVEVAATQPASPLGIPIATLAPSGGGYATVVGGQTIPFPAGSPVSLVVVDSVTGAVSTTAGYGPDDEVEALQFVQGLATSGTTPHPIVALSVLPGTNVSPGWDNVIKQIGGTETNPVALASGGWSVIGDPTASDGVINATDATRDLPLGPITGYVQNQVALSRHTFVTGGYVSYDTRATGSTATTNAMTIGGATYASTDVRGACAAGEDAAGFHVVLLDAATLKLVSSATTTTRCGSSMSLAGYNDFVNAVVTAATPVTRTLLFVQSIGSTPVLPSGPAGTPASASSPPSVNATAATLAAAIARLGGDPSTFLHPTAASDQGGDVIAPATDLAFVGGAYRDPVQIALPVGDAAEAYAGIPGATPPPGADGRSLRGTLRRTDRWQYAPATSSTMADAPPDLNAIAYQAPTPWPFTAASGATAAERAAYRWLSNRVLLELFRTGRYPTGACTRAGQPFAPATADVRQLYCATTIDPTGVISGVRWVSGTKAFTRADLATVKSGLAKELVWLASSRALFADLAAAYDGESGQTPQIESIVTNVQNAVDPAAKATVAGTWLGIASDVANLAASIFGIPEVTQDVANVINLISAAGFTASDALSEFDYSADATDLAAEAAARSESIAETIRALPAIFATDYGKLAAIAGTSLSDTQDVNTAVHLAFGRWAAGQLAPLGMTVRMVNQIDNDYVPIPVDCFGAAEITRRPFFRDLDGRAVFFVGQQIYVARDGDQEGFPAMSTDSFAPKPGPAAPALLDFLFGSYAVDAATGDVTSFGFAKQNFLWNMAAGPFTCVRSLR